MSSSLVDLTCEKLSGFFLFYVHWSLNCQNTHIDEGPFFTGIRPLVGHEVMSKQKSSEVVQGHNLFMPQPVL